MAGSDQWGPLEVLGEPRRREAYDLVRRSRTPLTRDDVAESIGITRALAAFHLDKLVEAGLLHVTFARPPGRGGPGAGRPSKRYTAAAVDVHLSLPPRRYDLAGRILARAVAGSPPEAEAAAARIAAEEGRATGRAHRPGGRLNPDRTLDAVHVVLDELGYEPRRDNACVRLGNCPFHDLVEVAPGLVCSVNQAFVSGVLDGIGGSSKVTAKLAAQPGDCCVSVCLRERRRAVERLQT